MFIKKEDKKSFPQKMGYPAKTNLEFIVTSLPIFKILLFCTDRPVFSRANQYNILGFFTVIKFIKN